MQCLTLKENFIFTSQVKLTIDRENAEILENIDSVLLVTINALYLFKKIDQNKNDDFLENKLLLKYLHKDIYVEKFSNETNQINYISIKKKEKPEEVKFSIKIEHPSAKEYIKILALFEGWKLAVKSSKITKADAHFKVNEDNENEIAENKSIKKSNRGFGNEPCPKPLFLFQIIDSFIQNNFVFQIDYLILQLYKVFPEFIENFFNVITIFPKIEIHLISEESLSDIFPLLFPNETDSMKESMPKGGLKYSLTDLSLKSIYLQDSYAQKILPPLIVKSPYLQTLDLSNNYLTNKIFNILIIRGFINVHLKTLNLSYNQLTSDNLSKYIFQISKQFLRITLFDLRGNKIDNRFLNSFNPKLYEDLRNQIHDRLSGNNSNNNYHKELITFDLRETNINLDKTSYRLYLKKKNDLSNHLEIKNNFNDNHESKFFGLDNINFIFDIYFFQKNFYKYIYNSCSRSKTILNIDVKNYQFKTPPTINEKKITKITPFKNWFYTGYYEKEDEPIETKLDVKSIDTINDKKKNKSEESKIKKKEDDKDKNKIKNDNVSSRKNKKVSSMKGSKNKGGNKKNVEVSSKTPGKESDSIFPESPKVIEEENNDNNSSSKEAENEKKEKEKEKEDKISDDDWDDDDSKKNQDEKENNNNKDISPIKEELSEEDKDKENDKISGDEDQNSPENKTINQKKTNDNRYHDTEIITKTDDESSEEELNKSQTPKTVQINKNNIENNKEKITNESPKKKKNNKKYNYKNSRVTVLKKNLDDEKIKKGKKYYELDLYRELFKFFFLCDYYFDPVLNSFATKMPQTIRREKSYMSIKNEERRYKDLKDYINFITSQKSLKKSKPDEDKIFTNDLYLDDAKQMYYDYMNFLRMKNSDIERRLTTKHLLISIFKNIIKNNSINILKNESKFNPNGLIDHMVFFYLYLATPHDYKIKIPLTTLNKLISRIKLESLLCLKEKSHHALGTLSKITSGLDISIKSQINSVYIQLTEKAKLISGGLEKVLNFDGYNSVDNVRGFLFETGNFLDIFLEKADNINLSNDLVILCKYIQYWRNNYIRNLIYHLLHEINKKEGATR